jgi:hypothetical protein
VRTERFWIVDLGHARRTLDTLRERRRAAPPSSFEEESTAVRVTEWKRGKIYGAAMKQPFAFQDPREETGSFPALSGLTGVHRLFHGSTRAFGDGTT